MASMISAKVHHVVFCVRAENQERAADLWRDIQPDFRSSHYLDGFAHADGKFHFKADWAHVPLGNAGMMGAWDQMPSLPDHWTAIEEADEAHPFRLATSPSRSFLNTSFTEMPSSRKREGRPTVLMHPADADGLGITEGAISLALVASGVHVRQAVAAAVLYRLISFWFNAALGWLILLFLRARRPAAQSAPEPALEPSAEPVPQTAPHPHELVLLHGQPGSAADWDAVLARLPAHLHAVAKDRPGYGASQRNAAGFTANAQVILDDLDQRGVDAAVLVAHSWAGGAALLAARLAPHRVKAVVLLAGVGPGSVTIVDWLLAAPVIGPLAAQVMWWWTPWIARVRLAWLSSREGRPLDPGEHLSLQVWGDKHAGAEPRWRAFLTEQRALLSELAELEGALPSIAVPVLLLADPADQIVPIMTAQRLAGELPHARLRLISDAGHHLPRRAPAAVAEAIAGFIATLDQNGRQRLG